MPLFANGLDALRTLKTYIQGELDSTYAALFEGYGGAACLLEDDSPQGSDQTSTEPTIILALEEDDRAAWSTPARPRNMVVARGDVNANDFSGAQTGADGEDGSDTVLSQTLIAIIEDGYAALEALGLMRPSIRAEREVIENSDAGELHANPHRIRFTYTKS